MRVDELSWNKKNGWFFHRKRVESRDSVQIVFIFGTATALKEREYFCSLRKLYPEAKIIGGSSAGNIQDSLISSDDIVATAIYFEKSRVEVAKREIDNINSSFQIGESILQELYSDDLQHILLFSDGININGSQLVDGITSDIDHRVTVSGGLFGEETATFQATYSVADGEVKDNGVIGVGLYGESLKVLSGSSAGWEDFGAERTITKSSGNIVYEIDDQPALDLYRKYLGDLAKDLPASGLRFPLNIWKDGEEPIIRTLFDIDEDNRSLIFIGDVPQNFKARLMKTNIDGLIDGAENAIKMTDFKKSRGSGEALCIAVSCIGRRVVLNQLVEEELEVIQDYLGNGVSTIGFYSYGEIAPFSNELKSCRFHNQTMTVTVIEERG